MNDIRIQDYIGYSRELTAEEVKKLPVGSRVTLHSFDRHGEHVMMDFTVVQSGKARILKAFDFRTGYTIEKRIRKETTRFCYTEAKK